MPVAAKTRFDVHGLSLAVSSSDPLLSVAVDRMLGGFPVAEGDGSTALQIELRSVKSRSDVPLPGAPERLLRVTGVTWPHAVLSEQGRTIVDFGEHGGLSVEADQATVFVVSPEALAPEARGGLLFVAFTELLAARGIFCLHAAAVAHNGHGAVICGASGAGKTTAALALVRAGWRLLSDDHPLIRKAGDGRLELLPFQVPIDVTDKTVGLFGELQDAQLEPGSRKHHFDLEAVYPDAAGVSASPSMLLFPKVAIAPKGGLEPLARPRALEELVRQGLPAERNLARAHLAVLSELVHSVPAFRLWSAEDITRLPDLITEALS